LKRNWQIGLSEESTDKELVLKEDLLRQEPLLDARKA
jgi:hypothetical protein